MDNNSVFIIMRNNSFLCRRADSISPVVYKFHDIQNLPNVPFYFHLWDNFMKYKREFGRFFRNELIGNPMMAWLIKNHSYLAIPDDMLESEKRIAIEFLMQCGSRKVDVMQECLLLAPQADKYVAVSRTCRMMVLSYIESGNIVNRSILENKEYSAKMLKHYIHELLGCQESDFVPVYLNGNDLQDYSELGLIVDPKTILNHYIDIM